MLLKNLIVPLFATFAVVTATFNLTSSLTKYASFDFSVGDISISKSASFSLVNQFDCGFSGNINIEKDCKFFLSSTADALKVSVAGLFNKIVNDGTWVVNSLESFASSTCNIVGASFQNTGELILAFKGALKVPIIKICSFDWHNSELKSSCLAELGQWGLSIENQGTICVTNSILHQVCSIKGSGCISIHKDSSFYIANALFPIDSAHTIYMGDGNPTIQAQPLAFPQTFKVANFGANGAHKIGLTVPLLSFSLLGQKSFSYDTKKGILTLRANGLISQQFNIGLGYDPSKFELCSDDSIGALNVNNGAIKYNGPCPNPGKPSVCQACPEVPTAPGCVPSTTTTTVTSTKTDGAICTEIDEVIISSDTTGSWFTTTSTHLTCGTPSQAPTPNTQVTKTSTYTGVTTQTITQTGSKTDTVIVEVPSTPNSQTTVTSYWTGTYATAVTTVTGDKTDTVTVYIPQTTSTSTLTTTNTWTGGFTTTVTTSGAVIIEVPSSDYSSSTSTSAPTTTTTGGDSGSFSTSYVTVTAQTTEVVTITSCANNGCHTTTAPTGVTVVTITTSDVQTVITTYCPLTQTHTLGVTGSSTYDLGCPTGWFGYHGLPGKNINIQASASAGLYIDLNLFHKRDNETETETSSSSSSAVVSSANGAGMNTIYGVEFLSAVAVVLALVF
ncbi:IFF11 Cell wall protein IFF11 [Candida maltosa Xu316]